jgi:lipopolysaccharide transport system ATP-binding protein
MNDFAISLTNVSKCFKRYHHPVDRLKEMIFPGTKRSEEFWALRDITLQIPKGETLGIVGRNGSGKSTLLQIVVGTLTATTGETLVNGRISALLELGSGFNPEYTGRQNVFFNGQLLGLKQQEIEERFDEIVGFADIGDFIDQPVKTYSSGMFVRLAFAVATSVDPDILIVDEALSVGDEAFQRKCFVRIQTLKEKGGTILFVSHSATAVIELCNSAVLLDRGELLLQSNPKFVLDKYHKLIYAPPEKEKQIRDEIRVLNQIRNTQKDTNQSLTVQDVKSFLPTKKSTPILEEEGKLSEFYDPALVPENTISYVPRGAKIVNPHITTLDGKKVNHLVGRNHYIYTYTVNFYKPVSHIRFGMLIKTLSGFELGGASCATNNHKIPYVEAGTNLVVKFQFQCLLHPGVYFLNAGVSGIVDGQFTYLSRCIDVAMFRVQPQLESCGSGIVDLLINPSVSIAEQEANLNVSELY